MITYLRQGKDFDRKEAINISTVTNTIVASDAAMGTDDGMDNVEEVEACE